MQQIGETHDSYKFKQSLVDFLNHNKCILCMNVFHESTYLPFNRTMPISDHIEKLFLKYNRQSINSTCGKVYVGNGRLFYFNYDGKLDVYYP